MSRSCRLEGVDVGLGTVLVGDDVPSERYVALKHEDCAAIGMYSVGRAPARHRDPGGGARRHRPLQRRPARSARSWCSCRCPAGLDEERALLAVDPDKDVDGLHPVNLGRLVLGTPGPLPCTPAGIVELLHAYDVPVEGRHVVIIGRGVTIGRPLAMLLSLKRPGLQRGGHRACTPASTSMTSRPSCARPTSSWPPPGARPGHARHGQAGCGGRVGGHDLGRPEADPRRARGRGRGGRMDHAPPRWGGPHDPCHAVAQRGDGRRPSKASAVRREAVRAVSEREYSERPWGNYTVLDDDAPDHKVKRLVVHPGKRLSYQRHSKRAEHWFIVSGTATVTLDGTVITVEAGRVDRHPAGGRAPHRQRGRHRRRLHRGAARHATSARTTSCGSRTTTAAEVRRRSDA